MRADPERLGFEIEARDGNARAGVLHTAHGPVRTPAFIPLATKATVRGLESAEVAELGYELVLGNTYHLFVSPGPDRIATAGGLHEFMGWERALITDSGGFQVFSLAHGGVADEVKGKGRPGGDHGSVVSIGEEGVRFKSYKDGRALFISPEVSMEVQAKLGSDIALVFDECTPYHADRDYTARSMERTHRWLDRCLAWHDEHGPERQAVFGIVQGGVHEDLRRASAQAVSEAGVDGIAIGGTLGRDKEEMRGVLELTAPLLPERAPKHLLGIGDVDDLLAGIALGLDVFDCAIPTRLARHGTALVPDPENRFRLDLRKSGWEGNREPIAQGCPCPACRRHDRDYLSYLSRAEELTAVRLLCLHNLAFMHSLVTGARDAIKAERLGEYAAGILAGDSPY
ncbi:MAG TPA: tRNA guanosine(34) transglycosylase Tgt [Solirubrobacterales bacterium]